MPWFEYEGLTPGGTAIVGRIEAPEQQRAADDLTQMQIEVHRLDLIRVPTPRTAALNEQDFIFFNEQLASLADAGIALDEGLQQLARDVESPKLRRWIEDVVADLKRGRPLDQAVAAREQGLPVFYSRVIRAGVETGQLSATLLNLNQHLRLTGNTRRILWEVISYPLVVLTFALAVVSFFFMLLVPGFRSIYADFGTQLPDMTVLLLNVSELWPTILISLVILVGAIIIIWHLLRITPGGRGIREEIVLTLPLIGRIERASLLSRFFRALATAVSSGLPLPQALQLGSGATGHLLLIADADRLAGEVERGHSIFAASQTTRIIPPLFGYCVQVATGRDELPIALEKLANSYANRAIHGQSMLRVYLVPTLIILLGLLIGIGVLGLFLPLVSLITAVSGGC